MLMPSLKAPQIAQPVSRVHLPLLGPTFRGQRTEDGGEERADRRGRGARAGEPGQQAPRGSRPAGLRGDGGGCCRPAGHQTPLPAPGAAGAALGRQPRAPHWPSRTAAQAAQETQAGADGQPSSPGDHTGCALPSAAGVGCSASSLGLPNLSQLVSHPDGAWQLLQARAGSGPTEGAPGLSRPAAPRCPPRPRQTGL